MHYTDQQIADLVRDDSVHKSVYTDPELFQLEMDRIYGHAWIYVGHESQVPEVGDFYATRIGDQDVIMTRGADKKINVLYNRCPHKGAQLVPADSCGNTGRFFRCPYHAWTFRTDGSLLSIPLNRGYDNVGLDQCEASGGMATVGAVKVYVTSCSAD